MRRSSLVLATSFCLLAGCAALSAPSGGDARSVALSPYLKVLQTVEVEIGGTRRPFLFDTGGGATLVTPKVAEAIGCTPFGRLTGFRHTGERLDIQSCGELAFNLGDVPLRAETGVFDLMSLLPKEPELGGLIAIQSLGGRPWTLDLAQMRLTVETPASLAARTKAMKEIAVRPSNQAGGATMDLMMRIDTPRGPLWLEVDSGSVVPVILSPHAWAMLGIEPPAKGANVDVTLSVSGFGPVTVKAFAKDTIYDGLLNADFLHKHVLSVDGDLKRAWLAPAGQ